jgi:hypothetical protein
MKQKEIVVQKIVNKVLREQAIHWTPTSSCGGEEQTQRLQVIYKATCEDARSSLGFS